MKKTILYKYLDINNPIIAWEVAIGRIKSNMFNNDKGFGVSFWQYSIFSAYSESRLKKSFSDEILLENIRKQFFKNKVSRLQGAYYFESENDAKKALKRWNIPLNIKYISKVSVYYDSITKVDSEWITKYLGESENDDWMYKYWSGESLGRKPVTEVLINGIGFIENKDLRIEAYKKIYNVYPYSTPLLSCALCGFSVLGLTDLALIKPATLNKEDKIVGGYYIYMKEFEDNQQKIAEIVKDCKKNNVFPEIIMPKDENVFSRLPDFTKFNFSINKNELSKDIINILGKIIK